MSATTSFCCALFRAIGCGVGTLRTQLSIETIFTSLDLDQPDLVDQAVGERDAAVARHVHVAHDVAPAGGRPGLEFLDLRIEPDDGVGLRAGLVVPERAFARRDSVRL